MLSSTGRFIAIVLLAFASVPIENLALWGYFFQRPSFTRDLKDLTGLQGVTLYEKGNGNVSIKSRDLIISRAKAARICSDPFNECLGESLLLAINDRFYSQVPPDVDEALLEQIWRQVQHEIVGKLSSYYKDQELPVAGWAFQYHDGHGREKFLLSYFTGEYMNDRHLYGEVIFDVGGARPVMEKQIRYSVEIAGIEFLSWRVLLFLNLACFLCIAAVWAIIKRGIRFTRKQEHGVDLHP